MPPRRGSFVPRLLLDRAWLKVDLVDGLVHHVKIGWPGSTTQCLRGHHDEAMRSDIC